MERLGVHGHRHHRGTAARQTAEALDCADACGVNLPEALANLTDRAFMIVIQDFQDPYTLNVKQLMKCCVEEITPDGRLIPFCAYNSVGYREQVRDQMSGVAVADVVPNAPPLQPLLIDSPYGSKIAATGNGHRTGDRAGPTNVGRRAVTAVATPAEIKACCAAAYGNDAVALLLGESYHPGGLTLTRRLADAARGCAPASGSLDVAAGPGTTALLLAADHGVTRRRRRPRPANSRRSPRAPTARPAGLAERCGSTVGDAERLPFAGRHASTPWCASARSAPSPTRPPPPPSSPGSCDPAGGSASPTSPSTPDRLPHELTGLAAWVACIADARPLDEYAAILDRAGLRIVHTERHDAGDARG